jgi:4-hydroxybenzoate polyprenyltransferase
MNKVALSCWKEAQITFLLMRSNLIGAMIVGIIFTISIYNSAAKVSDVVSILCLPWYFTATLIFFLYQYTFELANQAYGVEEDRINKPNRPVPAGLIKVEQLRT